MSAFSPAKLQGWNETRCRQSSYNRLSSCISSNNISYPNFTPPNANCVVPTNQCGPGISNTGNNYSSTPPSTTTSTGGQSSVANTPPVSMSNSNPIAGFFTVSPNMITGPAQGLYLTSMDLFFQTKDQTLGISISLVDLVTGYPDSTILPFSKVHLAANQVSTSNDASVATHFKFNAPVIVQEGSYAFLIEADGGSPNYSVWTATIGNTDIKTGSPIYSFSAAGCLFLSTLNALPTWTAQLNQAVKFNLYYAAFSAASGTASFVNDTSEYFTLANTSGIFNLGDPVVLGNMSNGISGGLYASSNATINSGSNNILVVNTSGLTTSSVVGITSVTQQISLVANVVSITNTTCFVINTKPSANDTAASVYRVDLNPNGFVQGVNTTFMKVVNSTANTTNFLSNTYDYAVIDTFTGGFSTANALIDMPYNTLVPQFSTSIPPTTTMNPVTRGVTNSTAGYVVDNSYANVIFGSPTAFLDKERVVMSRSNELASISGNKSLIINCNMTTQSLYLSPAIDNIRSGALLIENLVNSDNSTLGFYNAEITGVSNCINRYISTTVTLASGLDAEDLIVWTSLYWPPNTEVYVYAKIQSQYDSQNFNTMPWSPMQTNNSYVSSKTNLLDFAEFEWTFPNTAPSPQNFTAYHDFSNNGVVAYNTPGGNIFEEFVTYAVKIVLMAQSSPIIPRIGDQRAIAVAAQN